MRLGPSKPRSPLAGYAVAVLVSAAFLALELLWPSALAPSVASLLVVAPPLVASWYGGLGPGLVASALATASGESFLLARASREGSSSAGAAVLQALAIAAECAIVAVVIASIRSSRLKAHASAQRIRAIYEMAARLGTAVTPSEVGDVILHQGLGAYDSAAAAVFLASASPTGPLRMVAGMEDPRMLEFRRMFE
jgi:K+-sensing histidine kinase KdpD